MNIPNEYASTSPEAQHLDPQVADANEANRGTAIAPWWHTALIVVLIVATSLLGLRHGGVRSRGSHHIRLYTFSILWEWALAGIVVWGLWMRKVPIRKLLGERRRGVKSWFDDFGAALGFWLIALMVLAPLRALLDLMHSDTAAAAQNAAIRKLAPLSATELMLWVALSVSAGICEEFIFRGYLQQQFSSLKLKFGRLQGAVSPRLWVGVACSAVLFGGAHGYEGFVKMVLIAALGAVLSGLVAYRGSLRSSMMMHAWHDIFTGVTLLVLRHAHKI